MRAHIGKDEGGLEEEHKEIKNILRVAICT
jgi:hypothetical protein